jgi:cytidylate kinase
VSGALYAQVVAFGVICISRADGAGGEDVGREVASRLGFRYIDEEVVDRAAERGGVDASSVSDAEKRRSTLRRLLDATGPVSEVRQVTPVDDPEWKYIQTESRSEALRGLIREAIKESADEGQVVIVAHAASYALAGRPDSLRVLVTGSPDERGRRLAGSELGADDSASAVRSSDKARASYLREFYGVENELPIHYDLVINSDRLTTSQAAEVVAAASQLSAP